MQKDMRGNRYLEASLSKLRIEVDEAQRIINWIKNPKNFLVYIGSPGCGKTYFCHALIRETKFRTFRLWNEKDLLMRIRNSMTLQGDYIRSLHDLIDDDLTILDDLGSSGFTEWRIEILFELLDFRYGSRLPTVITSNLNPTEILEALGERFHSRLFAVENTILMSNGSDLRKEGL